MAKKITKIQLQKLDIHEDSSKLHRRRYWCNTTQSHLYIHASTTQKDLVERIYRKGFENGIVDGMRKRSVQFKTLLNNEDL
jgi:hypothetical protein